MENSWKKVYLDEVVSLRNGAGIKQQYYCIDGIPLSRVSNFTSDSIDLSDCVYVETEHANKWMNHFLKFGDVVVATVGSWPPNWASVVGKVISVPKSAEGSIQNQNSCCLIPKVELIDNRFLFYLLKSYEFKMYAANAAGGSANQARLPVANLAKYQLKLPSLEEQKNIAHILGSLDNKIELNRQMNQTLEQMAQALFKSWFVDFDPVIDNALAAAKPIPEELQAKAEKRKALGKDRKALPEEIQKLFPDEFEYSEELEKWVPLGWKSVKFDSIAEVKYGKDHKKLEEGNIPVYGSGGIMRYVNQSLYTGESVLIPRKGTLSNLMYVNEEFWSVDTMFFTILKKEKHAKYLYYNLKLLDFNEMNVGSAVPSMTTKVLNSLDFILPQTDLVETFDDYIQNLYNKIEANITQINNLTKTRDTLLPKLISGEVRVPEVEKMIE